MLSRRLLRIKVVKTLYSHFKSESESLIASEKNLQNSVEKTYDLYHQMLYLIAEIAKYAEGRIELGKRKKLPTKEEINPNTRFVDNALIAQIQCSEDLETYLTRRSLGWVNQQDLIRTLYNALIASDFYKEYMEEPTNNYKSDVKLVKDFYTKIVEDNQMMEDVIEEQSILWSDDIDFVLILIVKTLGSCKANQTDLPLLPKYKNDDDETFLKELYRKALVNNKEYLEYIDKFTQNWDVERIAFLDNIIMIAAIAEILAFPSIPVKVTLDEYIEIAKYYSTPGSSLFINGILDKIVESLEKEGKIEKFGRGLL